MKKLLTVFLAVLASDAYPQSDLEKIINAGGLILTGINILTGKKPDTATAKTEESLADATTLSKFCVANKLEGKIIFRLTSKDAEGKEIGHELVVLSGEKECLYEVPKGIWTYEVVLADESVYRKGQYQMEKQSSFTVK